MTKVTFYAGGLSHFFDHLFPIYQALDPKLRGPFHARAGAAGRAVQSGINPVRFPPRRAALVVVASYEDHRAVAPSPTVLVNHGVGQRYLGDPAVADHPSYTGGRDRDRVVLYLCPSQRDAEACRDSGALAVAVGVPKMDPFHLASATRYPVTGPPVVAVSFHADIHLCPETRWSFPYFKDSIEELVGKGTYPILGHCHPRSRTLLERWWQRLKVPFAPTFDQVLREASLYVCDNSSTLYEFASTGRPVLVLNSPLYRRDVHHGLRFWDHIPGLEVNQPQDLERGIAHALEDPPELRKKREEAVAAAYDGVALDGKASLRAAAAIKEYVSHA